MEHIGKHMESGSARSKKERQTERGELMKYFIERLNPGRVRDGYAPLTLARMGRTLVAIPTRDLYYLKSVCEDAEARGKDFSKKFWWEVKPKKEENKDNG
jgi:hypothetical protein